MKIARKPAALLFTPEANFCAKCAPDTHNNSYIPVALKKEENQAVSCLSHCSTTLLDCIAESMILLGSIERTELQAVFDWWLSPERRVFERGQSSPGQGSKVSWESFTFVDEGSREDSRDKVKGGKPETNHGHSALCLSCQP